MTLMTVFTWYLLMLDGHPLVKLGLFRIINLPC